MLAGPGYPYTRSPGPISCSEGEPPLRWRWARRSASGNLALTVYAPHIWRTISRHGGGSATPSATKTARINYAHPVLRAPLGCGASSLKKGGASAKAATRNGLKASAGRIALARKLVCAKRACNSAVAIAAGGVATSPPTTSAWCAPICVWPQPLAETERTLPHQEALHLPA